MNDAMHQKKLSEYRAAAAACVKWAEAKEIKKEPSLRWRKLADEWTHFADEIERQLSTESDADGTKPD